jgi:hypothetical protein
LVGLLVFPVISQCVKWCAGQLVYMLNFNSVYFRQFFFWFLSYPKCGYIVRDIWLTNLYTVFRLFPAISQL